MNSNASVPRLLAAVLLFALSLVGLDVVDSARTVVVLGGYLWCATLAGAALFLVFRTLRPRRTLTDAQASTDAT